MFLSRNFSIGTWCFVVFCILCTALLSLARMLLWRYLQMFVLWNVQRLSFSIFHVFVAWDEVHFVKYSKLYCFCVWSALGQSVGGGQEDFCHEWVRLVVLHFTLFLVIFVVVVKNSEGDKDWMNESSEGWKQNIHKFPLWLSGWSSGSSSSSAWFHKGMSGIDNLFLYYWGMLG